MKEAGYPPRIFLSIAVDGDFNPYVKIQNEGDLRHWFGDPMHGKTKPGEWFIPLSEHQELIRQARAEAFEEAILMANTRRKKHNNSLVESLRLRAQEARRGSEKCALEESGGV